jgi:hypothetical protein
VVVAVVEEVVAVDRRQQHPLAVAPSQRQWRCLHLRRRHLQVQGQGLCSSLTWVTLQMLSRRSRSLLTF